MVLRRAAARIVLILLALSAVSASIAHPEQQEQQAPDAELRDEHAAALLAVESLLDKFTDKEGSPKRNVYLLAGNYVPLSTRKIGKYEVQLETREAPKPAIRIVTMEQHKELRLGQRANWILVSKVAHGKTLAAAENCFLVTVWIANFGPQGSNWEHSVQLECYTSNGKRVVNRRPQQH